MHLSSMIGTLLAWAIVGSTAGFAQSAPSHDLSSVDARSSNTRTVPNTYVQPDQENTSDDPSPSAVDRRPLDHHSMSPMPARAKALLQKRKADPARVWPTHHLKFRQPTRPKHGAHLSHPQMFKVKQALENPAVQGKLKRTGKVASMSLVFLCGLGFVLPPPADAVIEASCLAEMGAEAAAKGIKHEVDKKNGRLPPKSTGMGGAGGEFSGIQRELTTGTKADKAKEVGKLGWKGFKFLSKVHV